MDTIDISIIEAIKKVPIFADLNDDEVYALAEKVEKEVLGANSLIFKKGDFGNKMFIILRGEIKVLSDEGEEIAVLVRGDFLGEMALISDTPRNATCVSNTEVELIVLSRNDFQELLKLYPSISKTVNRENILRTAENKHREESIGDENLY